MSNTKKKKSTTAQVWTIKGVEAETKSKVKAAAKKAGTTIGAYVNRTLLESANNDLKKERALPIKMEDIQTQLADMSSAIIRLSEKMDKPEKEPEVKKEGLIKRIFG